MLTNEANDRREGKLPYDTGMLEFTNKMNTELAQLEAELLNTELQEVFPNIFIIGLSRSGTTLLSQILFNCLDIACTNNLMAKFWKAPLVGAQLSKMVLQDKKSSSFESNYGRTNDAYSPNEFGWFWSNVFNVDPTKPLDYAKGFPKIDWPHLRSVFININHILNKPLVYKPAELLVPRLEEFDKGLSKSIYIYIERDLTDVAISFANSRLDYYNDINKNWWSPLFNFPEQEKLLKEPYEIQIAGHLYHFGKICEEKLSKISINKVIRIKYEELCLNPQKLLDTVRAKTNSNYNYDIVQSATPKIFKVSHPTIEESIKKKLIAGLKSFFGNSIEG